MATTFFISDTHFGHKNILTFPVEGKMDVRYRPFGTVEEMNEALINNWNAIVSPNDIVYHLGDISFKKSLMEDILPQLKGHKYLVLGNHDTHNFDFYKRFFNKIYALKEYDNFVLTHIPIYKYTISRWRGNIHGHTHRIKIEDDFYYNVCVEQHDYKPIAYDVILRHYSAQERE